MRPDSGTQIPQRGPLRFLPPTDDDDVRPFFGERSDPVGWPPPPTKPVRPAAATFTERYDRFLAAGVCPSAACHQPLEDGRCRACGWDKAVHNRPVPDGLPDDYVPRLPGALFDE